MATAQDVGRGAGAGAPSTVRVALCDDHPVLLDSMQVALGRDPRFEVVATATGHDQLFAVLDPARTDLVVVDVAMTPVGGIEVARRLRNQYPGLRVLVLSGYDDPFLVREALEVGAGGYLLKTSNIGVLKDAMLSVAAGARVLDPAIDLRPATAMLTRRQTEILEMLDQGMSRAEIADALIVSVNTVKGHLSLLYEALEVGSAREAVHRARELGWLPVAPGLLDG